MAQNILAGCYSSRRCLERSRELRAKASAPGMLLLRFSACCTPRCQGVFNDIGKGTREWLAVCLLTSRGYDSPPPREVFTFRSEDKRQSCIWTDLTTPISDSVHIDMLARFSISLLALAFPSALAAVIEERQLYTPPVFTPDASTVWHIGAEASATW